MKYNWILENISRMEICVIPLLLLFERKSVKISVFLILYNTYILEDQSYLQSILKMSEKFYTNSTIWDQLLDLDSFWWTNESVLKKAPILKSPITFRFIDKSETTYKHINDLTGQENF